MTLTAKVRQALKAKAHKLRPIVIIGNNGLTENVMNEIDRGLYDHELIKIRISSEDRDVRREIFAEICEASRAEPVQLIGSVATLYRVSEKI